MENFCFYEEIGEKNCKPYILLLMMNDLLGETADDKKLVRNFNCFGDEPFGLLEKLNRIFFNVMHYLPDKQIKKMNSVLKEKHSVFENINELFCFYKKTINWFCIYYKDEKLCKIWIKSDGEQSRLERGKIDKIFQVHKYFEQFKNIMDNLERNRKRLTNF